MGHAVLPIEREIIDVRNQIIDLFRPEQIYLFGSWAKGTARQNSDIDLCVIAAAKDKRALVRAILLQVEYRGLEKFAKDCAFLNTYDVETRYPQEDPLIVDENDVRECLRIANELLNKNGVYSTLS